MKRSRAILLFGAMLLALAAYVAWCGRTFYLKPRTFAGDVAGIPEDVMRTVREWNEGQDLFGPEPFDASTFLWLLVHPYESGPAPIRMIMNGGYHIIAHPGLGRHPEVVELCVEEDRQHGHRIMIHHQTRGSMPASRFRPGK